MSVTFRPRRFPFSLGHGVVDTDLSATRRGLAHDRRPAARAHSGAFERDEGKVDRRDARLDQVDVADDPATQRRSGRS
jgi:hypothetical protein